MQPNTTRPVYIVQPSTITHLNVHPTIISTSGQQMQTMRTIQTMQTANAYANNNQNGGYTNTWFY